LLQVGPLINIGGLQKVQHHVKDALQKGAKLLTGGEIHALGGTFFEPTVLVDCREEMLVFREETFGPVCSVFKFATEEEGVRMANHTEFGLAAYVFAGEMGKGWRVAEGIEAGMVGVNEGMISTAVAPFGGVKESGLGREGARGGIEEYMETKYLCLGGIR
jgi:succinate-semialdehyde dehydrogenase/glutarate-semialdehyde dehydrogenase